MRTAAWLGLLLAFSFAGARAQSATAPVAVEVFQVLDIPAAINNPVLVKTKRGYLLKCSISSSSEFKQLGLRYSLTVIDSSDRKRVISQNEGFKLAPYQTSEITFKTPISLKLNGNERLVFMLEHLTTTDYVWEVINRREALTAYLAGDYSITPRVLRVRNQFDPPPRIGIEY